MERSCLQNESSLPKKVMNNRPMGKGDLGTLHMWWLDDRTDDHLILEGRRKRITYDLNTLGAQIISMKATSA